jgi:tRNA A37 threonylcarbamoyladenosine dehydratase
MDPIFSRMERILPPERLAVLEQAHVAVFGIGGVGGALCEALVRAGVGEITIVDKDEVDPTNINRQLIALHSTVGRPKVEVMRERMADIAPSCRVHIRQEFFLPETADTYDFSQFSYVADAVDTVTAKLEIIARAKAADVPVISAMGAGNKLDAGALQVADLYDTSVCPLARVMRAECRKRGFTDIPVVYSTEPAYPVRSAEGETHPAPGSISYVPPVAGYLMAGKILRDLLGV